MDFPIGSLVVLITFILISSGIVNLPQRVFKLLVFGLAGILLAGFLIIPLPAPRGIALSLNTGHALIPLLMAMFVWSEAGIEDKYRASIGTLAVGLTLYGISALLDLEPGLFAHPLLYIAPITIVVALLTGKTITASCLGVVSGCTLVSALRFLQVVCTPDLVTRFELPGSLVWNTMSISAISCMGLLAVKVTAAARWQEYFAARNCREAGISPLQPDSELSSSAESCEPAGNEFMHPEQ